MSHADDRKLRYFLTIARSESLSAAAANLGISQSALSRHLKQLEDYIGRPLFIRTGHGVELTDIGSRLEDAARISYKTIDQNIDALRVHPNGHDGTLRIAMVHTLSYYFLPNLLARFHAAYPQVNTYLLGRGSPEVVRLVETGRADLGFVYDVAVTIEGLAVDRLFEERMCLFQHKSWNIMPPAKVEEKWSAPLITFPKYYALRRMLHRESLDNNVIAEVDTVDIMLRLVSKKLGVCILPHPIQQEQAEHLQLECRPIALPGLRRWVVSIRRANIAQPKICIELITLAKAYAEIFAVAH